jgi:glutathione S-transferase
MNLYFSPGACSLAVHIALREAGLDFNLAKVDLATHRLDDGSDYFAVAPRGYVPLLRLDDGSRHTEAAALLQHVAEAAPAARPAGRARQQAAISGSAVAHVREQRAAQDVQPMAVAQRHRRIDLTRAASRPQVRAALVAEGLAK